MAAINLFIFSLLTIVSNPTLSLSFRSLNPNPNFYSTTIALFGDAEVIKSGTSVQLTKLTPSSSGLLLLTRPFKFLNATSFSTDFSFSVAPHSGCSLALVLVPTNFPKNFSSKTPLSLSRESIFLDINYDSRVDSSLVSVRISNFSSLHLVLNSETMLRSWIDYDASSRRLEVRLGEMGKTRPHNPLLAYPIDLCEMWKGDEALVGISSSSGDSVQTTTVYSWRFRVSNVPKGLHSLPVDPRMYPARRIEHESIPCYLSVLSWFMIGAGIATFVVFMVMFVRVIFTDWSKVIPEEEFSLVPRGFAYEKVSVVVENSLENIKG